MYDPLRMFNFELEFLDIVHPKTLEDVSDQVKLAVESANLDKVSKTIEIVFRLFSDGVHDIYECLEAQEGMTLRISFICSNGDKAYQFDLNQTKILKAETRMSYTSDSELLKEKITFQYESLDAVK